MSPAHSVSEWIGSLKAGDIKAVQKLWDRYRDQLLELAKKKLSGMPKEVADEEDVLQSVFLSLYRGATAGRFDDVMNRDDLWWLLLSITKQKTVDQIRRQTAKKRGAGRTKSETAFSVQGSSAQGFFAGVVGDEPTPDFMAMLDEQNRRLLEMLRDDRLRQIAVSRIEGYTVVEIAAEHAVSTRSIERKLQLIRNAWAKELIDAERSANSG